MSNSVRNQPQPVISSLPEDPMQKPENARSSTTGCTTSLIVNRPAEDNQASQIELKSITSHSVMPCTKAAVDDFISKEASYKKSGKYEDHLQDGLQALNVANKLKYKSGSLQIYLQLPSSAFYLGKKDLGLSYIQKAISLAEETEDSFRQIKAIYLKSAYQRQDEKPEAIATLNKARELYVQSGIKSDSLAAKIEYNDAANHMDIPGYQNFDRAAEYLKRCKELNNQAGILTDDVRIDMRLAGLKTRQQLYPEAGAILDTLKPKLSTNKEKAQHGYLEAKNEHFQNHWEKAMELTLKALEIANADKLQPDADRLKKLMGLIEKKEHLKE